MKNLLFTLLTMTITSSFAQSNYHNLVGEGLQFLKQRNIPAAIDKYQQAYEIDFSKVEANYGLGTAYQFLCQKQGTNCFTALKYLNKAIEIDDSYRNCYYNRGSIKNTIKDYNGAIADFTKAITKDPTKPNYYINRSLAYQKLGNTDNECKDLKKAAKLNSSNAKQLLITRGCK